MSVFLSMQMVFPLFVYSFLIRLCRPSFSAPHFSGQSISCGSQVSWDRHSHIYQLTDDLSGAQIQSPSERSQMVGLFQELTPDFINSSWDARSQSANMAGRSHPCEDGMEGVLRQVGRRNVQSMPILSLVSVTALSVILAVLFPEIFTWRHPSHY